MLVLAVDSQVHVRNRRGPGRRDVRGRASEGTILLPEHRSGGIAGAIVHQVDCAALLSPTVERGSRTFEDLDALDAHERVHETRQIRGSLREAIVQIAGVESANDEA